MCCDNGIPIDKPNIATYVNARSADRPVGTVDDNWLPDTSRYLPGDETLTNPRQHATSLHIAQSCSAFAVRTSTPLASSMDRCLRSRRSCSSPASCSVKSMAPTKTCTHKHLPLPTSALLEIANASRNKFFTVQNVRERGQQGEDGGNGATQPVGAHVQRPATHTQSEALEAIPTPPLSNANEARCGSLHELCC